MQGHYGNYHSTTRTQGTIQFINPMMPLQWFFRLQDIAEQIGFSDRVQDSQDMYDVVRAYHIYRAITVLRPKSLIPLL